MNCIGRWSGMSAQAPPHLCTITESHCANVQRNYHVFNIQMLLLLDCWSQGKEHTAALYISKHFLHTFALCRGRKQHHYACPFSYSLHDQSMCRQVICTGLCAWVAQPALPKHCDKPSCKQLEDKSSLNISWEKNLQQFKYSTGRI